LRTMVPLRSEVSVADPASTVPDGPGATGWPRRRALSLACYQPVTHEVLAVTAG
jgi:hypothetical protein